MGAVPCRGSLMSMCPTERTRVCVYTINHKARQTTHTALPLLATCSIAFAIFLALRRPAGGALRVNGDNMLSVYVVQVQHIADAERSKQGD